ncbi:hypothetical protein BOX15_Mlig031772g1, partial [Macrostomum lignano]
DKASKDSAGDNREASEAKPIGDGSGGGGSGRAREHRDSESSTDPQHRDQAQAASQPDDRRSPRSPRFVNPEQQFGRSPDVYVTLEKLMEAQEAFNNLVLAHEVATNDNFRFEPPATSASEASSAASSGGAAAAAAAVSAASPEELERRVRETMHRAFWDMLTENLAKQPPDYSQAVTLIGEIKTILLSLLPNNERARQQIEEVLDLELIRQKVEHGAFDINYYSNYVLDLMGKMCAPARDEAIRACAAIQEPVALFRELFRLLDLMKLDMANFTMQQMRPYIRQQAVTYEREKFEQLLASQAAVGVDGLRRTRAWLSESAAALPAAERTPSRVVSEALLRLVDWRQSRPQPEADWWPETLVMDAQKLVGIRDRLAQLHCVCACVLLAMGALGQRLPEDRRPAFKARATAAAAAVLADCPADRLDSAAAGLADTLAKSAESADYRVNDKECQLLTAQLADLPVHAAARLLHSRLMDFLREGLQDLQARQVRLPTGYSAVEAELAQVAGAFLRLCAHNRAVFGQLYDKLLMPDGRAGQAAEGQESRGEEQGCN